MSSFEKLLKKFKSFPTDFKYDEVKRLLSHFGYEEKTKGMTSGSRCAFFRESDKRIIYLHKPHGKINEPIKRYVLDDIYNKLVEGGDIEDEKQ